MISIKEHYKNIRENRIVKILKVIYNRIKYSFLSDKSFAKLTFRLNQSYTLNLKNPKRLNEKIQWLKLYDRSPLHTQCADKYKVRNFVKEKIGKEYLIPLYYFTKDPSKITPENLIHFPCIIKTNHNSSGGIIIRSKLNQDWKSHQNWLKNELSKNYYFESREWQYKNIDRGIVVEKLLQTKNGEIPFDLKVHCFHGKVEFFEVINDRFIKATKSYYNRDWEMQSFFWSSSFNKDGGFISGDKQEKPMKLELIIQLAEKLAQSFIYVRIDFYINDSKVYFGEITFHPISGLGKFSPLKWDLYYGNKLVLNKL